ncbi:conserved hypothetical protein [Sphingomonas aurantiaca]|uniref:YozE SAM-like domain-containing protein n=1 Tax=Sphingomonas aurantiaca TaxID=185949 RepID=A0A5E7ZZB6_9SPHN|nr:hypothetical protein [Sphingomonas aurantiaca]VVT24332.1 conserved hypothetical protein [Sphingomonas aurantiaca]
MTDDHEQDDAPAVAFGAWLLTQRDGGGFVGQLANAAAIDRAFPISADVDAAREWLQANRTSGDDGEAAEDAETKWIAEAG